MNATALVDALAAPLDAMRRRAFATATRSRTLRHILRARDRRLALRATVQVAAIFALTIARPAWLFVLGPVLFGVPHLASDVRYLLVRRKPGHVAIGLACIAAGAIILLRAFVLAHWLDPRSLRVEGPIGAAWVAAALLAGALEKRPEGAPGSPRSRWFLLALLPAIGAAGASAALRPWMARTLLAQAHNIVGIAIALVLFRRGRRILWAPAIAVVLGAALLATRLALRWTLEAGGVTAFGVHLFRAGAQLWPATSPACQATAALLFVFLQAVHYAAWIGWIPEEELPGEGTLTFAMTGRSLARDFTPWGLGFIVATCFAMVGAAWTDARGAAGVYMQLASFHAYFEIAMVAYLGARGRFA